MPHILRSLLEGFLNASWFWKATLCVIVLGLIFYGAPVDTNIKSMDKRKTEYRKEVETLEAKPDPKMSPAETEQWLYKLHLLFYDGIPDKYDQAGNKIKGVQPDPVKALGYLEAACKFGNPRLWLKLAGIHQNGMYNHEPDLVKARDLYYHIQETFPHNDVITEATEQLNSTITEIHNIGTHKWLNLPYTPKKNTHHATVAQRLKQTGGTETGIFGGLGFGGFGGSVGAGTIRATDLFRTHQNNTMTIPNGFDVFGNFGIAGGTHILDDNDPRRNDMHNTHNSQVVSTVANSLKKIQAITDLKHTSPETIRQIRQYINSKPRCDKTDDALRSLDSIERNIIPVSSVGMREVDALNIVWNRMHSETFEKNQGDLKDILYDQLADMQEHGKPVCATGRLERIVDTLNTFDDNVQIKPTYIINEEMMDKASKVNNDLIAEYGIRHGAERQKQLEMGTAPDQNDFDNHVKGTVQDILRKDYVDTGIMTKDQFDTQVGKWINEI